MTPHLARNVLPHFLYALDLAGVSVFAISGALEAGRKRLDLIGVMVLALVTAIGGGTIRDVLLARHPIFWLADQTYIIVIIASALATVAYARWRHPPQASLLVADALGLALFSIVGAQIAERAGLPAVSCVILGTVTGAAGGVVRDVLSMEIPLVLRRGNLYATAAIIGTSVYFALVHGGLSRDIAAIAGMVVVVAIRLSSLRWGITVPAFELSNTREYESPRAHESDEP